mmetsp:Transcript_5887/g.9037  ORF Transcript_5887/g.9037 Transcript_5887/m.9037 type:complete len:180 (-) Transcript_5887:27-566(-)
MRAAHDHPLFPEDNGRVYYDIEEATRSTKYAATIKPYQRRKDGRGAWLFILALHAFLHNCRWRSNGSFAFSEHFVAQHRSAFTVLTQCKEYIPTFQLPSANTRVNYFLDAIETSDSELLASMALVQANNEADGKMNNFEDVTSYGIPADPVSKCKTSKKRPLAGIAALDTDEKLGAAAQ